MDDSPLKTYRTAQGMTQVALAERLDVSKGTVSRWESGARTPRRRELTKIADLTGIAPAKMLGLA